MKLIPVNSNPFVASALDGEVVWVCSGPGKPLAVSFAPEAVLRSLEPMREAAERAIRQRSLKTPGR